jgi:hypothetical protein
MISPPKLLSAVPNGLRQPLFAEFNEIIQNYLESRWRPSELSGGRFCEIVYSILHGHASGTYPSRPSKPRDFVAACRALEGNTHVPRSFRILVPRMLPPLYEVRNNRNVGHAGGDVDSNFMDATVVVATAKWIVGELVRVFHDLTTSEAQTVVDSLAEVTLPLVWTEGDMRRVLATDLSLKDQVLMLLGSTPAAISYVDLVRWIEPKNETYLLRTVRQLHSQRHLEFHQTCGSLKLLPPGAKVVAKVAQQREV